MSKILRNDPNKRMDNAVGFGVAVGAGFPEADYAHLDPQRLPDWIEQLRNTEATARQLRQRLESMLHDDARTCAGCGGAVTGRADRIYCGATCRQRARRASRLDP